MNLIIKFLGIILYSQLFISSISFAQGDGIGVSIDYKELGKGYINLNGIIKNVNLKGFGGAYFLYTQNNEKYFLGGQWEEPKSFFECLSNNVGKKVHIEGQRLEYHYDGPLGTYDIIQFHPDSICTPIK